MQAPTGIIDLEQPPSPTLLLIPEDYPKIFRDPAKLYAHPDDYDIDHVPIQPDFFMYKAGTRSRLFLRISIAIDTNSKPCYTSATFLLDTGACPHFYISDRLASIIERRIKKQDAGEDYIKVDVGSEECRCVVKTDLPSVHQPANVMGLPMLFLMGLQLNQQRVSTFVFDKEGIARSIGTQKLVVI